MQVVNIQAEPRKPHGRRVVARMRRQGRIPGIIYGHKQDPQPVSLDRHEIELHVEQGAHLVQLNLDGGAETCLIKDVQFDPLGIHAIHVDFTRVDLTERVRVKVPIELRGHAKGIAEGGVLSQQLKELEIECLVTSIPDSIRVPINDLGLNQMLHVRELPLPEGVRALAEPEAIVALCREVLVVEAPAAAAPIEAASTEPEVIAKGKLPEEGEEAAEAEKKK